jgi:hypothetical protein
VFVAVKRDSGVGTLVRVDPDSDGHRSMPFSVMETEVGTPDSG